MPTPRLGRCPRAGADDDCVAAPRAGVWSVDESSERSFIRYRRMLASWRLATGAGMSDADWVARVSELDDRVAALAGTGFVPTPTAEQAELAGALGIEACLLVKDETVNVSGSHKARHTFGIAVWLAVGAEPVEGELAIASCGNAALGAAVVAAATDRELRVFVPPTASPTVLDRLDHLGARIELCPRRPGEAGDPCYLRFREAVASGAVPFGCQGPDNGWTIDGGRTLGFELAEQVGPEGLDRVYVQVGGGALATSVFDGLAVAARSGALDTMPICQAVQAAGCAPLARAVRSVRTDFGGDVDEASAHRNRVMVPWESPASVAGGILDDETYDWQAVTRHLLATGGRVLVVDEALLIEANRLGRTHTGIDVDHTGTAGLAGLMADDDDFGSGERLAVLFTGHRR